MLGYFKMPEKTAEDTTDDGFFHTGDCGEIDADGRLRVTGRVKELFKTSKGKYVAPAPNENRLSTHPKVEAVCVTGSEERRVGKECVRTCRSRGWRQRKQKK